MLSADRLSLDPQFIGERQRVHVRKVLVRRGDHLTMSSALKGGLDAGSNQLEARLLDEVHREAKHAAELDALAKLVDERDLGAVGIERRTHDSPATGTRTQAYASILFVARRRGKILAGTRLSPCGC